MAVEGCGDEGVVRRVADGTERGGGARWGGELKKVGDEGWAGREADRGCEQAGRGNARHGGGGDWV